MADSERPRPRFPQSAPSRRSRRFGPDWDTEDAYWQSAYPERLRPRRSQLRVLPRRLSASAPSPQCGGGARVGDTEHRLRADWLAGDMA